MLFRPGSAPSESFTSSISFERGQTMRILTAWMGFLLLGAGMLGNTQPGVAQASSSSTRPAAPPASTAAIEGRITVAETVNRVARTDPLRNLPVYLFTLDQSKPLLDLERKCRHSMSHPAATSRVEGTNAFAAYNICMQCRSDAVDRVPRLPATASTKTDADGAYHFDGLLPGRRYQVVSVKKEEDEPTAIAGLSPRLKPGQRAKLDLSENDPWTDADPLIH